MDKYFFDCGTHFFQGFHQIAEKHGINKEWHCFTFEANPNTFRAARLLDSYPDDRYFNVAVCNAAVTNGAGLMNVHCGSDKEGFTSQGSNILKEPPAKDMVYGTEFHYDKKETLVPSVSLSHMMQTSLAEGDECVVKLDIEGAEYAVLGDMMQTGTLRLVTHLYVEYHSRFFEGDASHSAKDIEHIVEQYCKQNSIELTIWH